MSALVAISLGTACATNHAEVEKARHSLFNADFAILYSEALNATRASSTRTLNDSPGAGRASTAWHQVALANSQDDLGAARSVGGGMSAPGTNTSGQGGTYGPQGGGAGGGGAMGMPTQLAYKRFFIRFDVTVLGGRPWRIKVVGHAAEWAPGAAMPSELHGVARPAWLDPRIDGLTLAIWKRVKQYAVPMPPDIGTKTDEVQHTDPAKFKDSAGGRGEGARGRQGCAVVRDNLRLRALLADDVVWSLGGEPGADTAMVMWQADSDMFETMAKTIDDGCAAAGDKKVTRPAAAPTRGQYQLVLEPRGDAWRVTSFVRAE